MVDIEFEPFAVGCALVGGLLVGLSSILNLFLYGHITGMSGYLSSSLMFRIKTGFAWKLTFICGLISAIIIPYIMFDGREFELESEDFELYDADSEAPNALRLLLGGLLVGFGTRLGSGCTSGHGLSGVGALSKRSFVAVGCFVGLALVTANVLRHTGFIEIGFLEDVREKLDRDVSQHVAGIILIVVIIVMVVGWVITFIKRGRKYICSEFKHFVIEYFLGVVFGAGLLLSGITRPSKVENFFVFDKNWDFTLLIFLIAAVAFNLVIYQLILRRRKDKPLMGESYQVPGGDNLDWRLIAGSLTFGVGWGFCLLAPGPAILACVFSGAGSFCFIFIVAGMYVFELFNLILRKNSDEPAVKDSEA